MEKTRRNPTVYLESLPDGPRDVMKRLDHVIAGVMKGRSRALWEGVFWGGTNQTIIGYGDVGTVQSRGKTVAWFMVGVALQKKYFSIYINAVEHGQYVAETYRSTLGKVKVGKASISFKRLEDLDLRALRTVLAIARDQSASRS